MTLKNFLRLHQNGCACISIHKLPYDDSKHGYAETYFEESDQEEIELSDIFQKVKNQKVNHFNVIGGGMYSVELCIYLEN